jgi:hypothetical protein
MACDLRSLDGCAPREPARTLAPKHCRVSSVATARGRAASASGLQATTARFLEDHLRRAFGRAVVDVRRLVMAWAGLVPTTATNMPTASAAVAGPSQRRGVNDSPLEARDVSSASSTLPECASAVARRRTFAWWPGADLSRRCPRPNRFRAGAGCAGRTGSGRCSGSGWSAAGSGRPSPRRRGRSRYARGRCH